MSDPVKERRYVLGLAATRQFPISTLASLEPPAPDVRVAYLNGSAEVFEVTEVHPDELPGRQGSPARAQEMRRARKDPSAIVASWVPTDAMPAIRFRVEQKTAKAPGYSVTAGETLSLLLVGSQPEIGAVSSSYIFAPFVSPKRLNAQTHALLAHSRFTHAYLHLPFSGNGLWGWNKSSGWAIVRRPDDISNEGREMLEALRELSGGAVLPGAKIFGYPRR